MFTYLFFIICLLTSFHIKIFVVLRKKNLTCIAHEHKPFLQLSPLDEFNINTIANPFVHENMKIPETYSEPSQTSRMELFANLVNG